MTKIYKYTDRQVCMTCYENNRQFSLTTPTRKKNHIKVNLGEKFSGIQILTFIMFCAAVINFYQLAHDIREQCMHVVHTQRKNDNKQNNLGAKKKNKL